MPKLIVEIAVALALTVGAILSFATGAHAGPVEVRDGYARASATKTATAGSIYFTIVGMGEADRLVAVSSPAADGAMLHETKAIDGVATMNHLAALEIPAEGEVVLKPSGVHVMLTGLKAPLEKGAKVAIVLTFERAGKVSLAVPVGSVGQFGPPTD